MALENMLYDDNTASETFELYGPKNYSMAEIKDLVERETLRHKRRINLPKTIYKPLANVVNKAIWWPLISADEVERECIDQVIDPKAKTFKDLGIEPAELSNLTFHYLVSLPPKIPGSRMLMSLNHLQQSYRSSSFYDLPPATQREKREEKKFLHVIDDQ